MKFVNPPTEVLSVTDSNGNTYKKTIYKQFNSLTGVTDENYPDYDSSSNYNTGDYVIVPDLKTIYRCTADNTSGKFPPAYPDLWVDWGFVNSYKMLATDEEIGAQTTGTDVKLEIDFDLADTFALINCEFEEVLAEEWNTENNVITGEDLGTGDGSNKDFYTDYAPVVTESETVYVNGTAKTRGTDYTIDYETGKITFGTAPAAGDDVTADYTFTSYRAVIEGKDVGVDTYAEYFFSNITIKTRLIDRNLDWDSPCILRLTFTGNTKIGNLLIGNSQEMGITLVGTALSFRDKSKIDTNPNTTYRKVIRYGHIRVLDAKIIFHNEQYDTVAQNINEIIGKNVLFIPDESDKYSEMSNLAYIESANLPVTNPVLTQYNMTLIGVE